MPNTTQKATAAGTTTRQQLARRSVLTFAAALASSTFLAGQADAATAAANPVGLGSANVRQRNITKGTVHVPGYSPTFAK